MSIQKTCCICGEQKLCSCAQVTLIPQQNGSLPRAVVAPLSPKVMERRLTGGQPMTDVFYICDACAERDGRAPKKLWITWIVSIVAMIVGLTITRIIGATNPLGLFLGAAGVWVWLFATLFLIAKSGLGGGKTLGLGLLSVFIAPVSFIVVPLLRKNINHNEKVTTALKKWAEDLIRQLMDRNPEFSFLAEGGSAAQIALQKWVEEQSPQKTSGQPVNAPAPQPASAEPARLPGSAAACAWAVGEDTAKMLDAIEKTWGVRVKPYRVSEEDAQALERAYPMVPPSRVEQAQYAVEMSLNSVFWHEYGSWIDFKYAKFLYRDRLYYVNVSPTVQLTQPMYDRKGDLNNMAKIMVCLAKQAGMDRDKLVFTLDGDLHDQT